MDLNINQPSRAERQETQIARQEKQIACFNKLGAYTIPILAIASWFVAMVYFVYLGGGWDSVAMGDFATHPIFMVTAFLLLGTFSVTCYRFCDDFGIPYDTARWIYISINSLVLLFAWMGWGVIYELHTNSGSHYKGSHSRVGVFTIAMWIVHYISGFCIFFFSSTKRNETMLDVHHIFGTMCIILALWTIALGLMWEEYDYDSTDDVYGRTRSGVVMGSVMLIIILVFGMMKYGRMLLPN